MRSIVLLLAFISLATSESVPLTGPKLGEDFPFELKDPDAIGVTRTLYQSNSDAQFYYFCEKTKKKQCGAWVDEKGNKVKGADLKVAFKGKEAVFLKVQQKDAGSYHTVFENAPISAWVNLEVVVPKKPKH
ncbi:hypothetical protein CRE_24811 [Caenorhabditis remanei]|uniref:Uncharacterized protein n=1 Tax=Caenorhabditis remanei TaxID=31234 RepID=E3NFS8_CAERE|nr:hypothetical protein CRE_24811 [Caenorhabditis remanei]